MRLRGTMYTSCLFMCVQNNNRVKKIFPRVGIHGALCIMFCNTVRILKNTGLVFINSKQ